MKKKSEQNDPIILKQKLIYFQLELYRYKEKLKKYEKNISAEHLVKLNSEKEKLFKELEQRNSELSNLKSQINELESENVILKEVALNKNENSQTQAQLEAKLTELQKKLTEMEEEIKNKELEQLERLKKSEVKQLEKDPSLNQVIKDRNNNYSNSWFINNLKNQHAITHPKPVRYKNKHYPSAHKQTMNSLVDQNKE